MQPSKTRFASITILTIVLVLSGPASSQMTADKELVDWCMDQARLHVGDAQDYRLLAQLAVLQAEAGRREDALRTAALAERRIPLTDVPVYCQAVSCLVEAYGRAGDRDASNRAVALVERAIGQLPSGDPEIDRAWGNLAQARARGGDREGWQPTARKTADQYFYAHQCIAIASALAATGRNAEFREALQAAASAAASDRLDSVRRGTVTALVRHGDIPAAMSIADGMANSTMKAWAYLDIAQYHIKDGNNQAATAAIAKASAVPSSSMIFGQWSILRDIAKAAHAAGQTAVAQSAMNRIRSYAEVHASPEKRYEPLIELSIAQACTGDLRGAARSFRAAHAAREHESSSQPLELIEGPCLALAEAQAAGGDFAGAEATTASIRHPILRGVANQSIVEERARAGRIVEALAPLSTITSADDRVRLIGAFARGLARSPQRQTLRPWIESLKNHDERLWACLRAVQALRAAAAPAPRQTG